jgi:hypothetical protein
LGWPNERIWLRSPRSVATARRWFPTPVPEQNGAMFENGSIHAVLAQEDFQLLGEDFWPWLVFALGAAMVVGNTLALVRPPADERDTGTRPSVTRAIVLIAVGLAAAAWGLASVLA